MTRPPPRYPDTDPLAFVVLNEITIIAQLARTSTEKALAPDLNAASFSLLNHLARLPGDWSPARLANAFQITKGAITNTVQRLEARGFSPDELAQVTCPIGLPGIRDKRPEVIAVSVAAQLMGLPA
jgi:hypothetical protein